MDDPYDPGPPFVSDNSFWGTHDHPIYGGVSAVGGTGSYTFAVADEPTDGSVTMNDGGGFTYTPNYQFYGTDSFTYTATDNGDDETSTAATITLTVSETAPMVQNFTYTILHDEVFSGDNLLTNSSDNEEDPLTISLVSGPSSALDFELNTDGSWAYLPAAGYIGDDSFTFQVSDGILTTNGTVTFHVVDQKPDAEDDNYYFSATDTEETIGVPAGVQANDSDPDDDALKSYLVTPPTSGSLTLNTDGSFTYTPVPTYIAKGVAITFMYKDTDGAMYSDTKTVTMNFIHVVITNPITELGGTMTTPANANGVGDEFQFDTSNPGVLTIPVKATVTPDTADVRNHLFMAVSADAIGDSSPSESGWTYSGGTWTDTLTYTGLPENNNDFGNKSLTVYALPGDSATVPYQVFYDKTATNHPGGDQTPPNIVSNRSPNWFYYWLQVIGSSADVYYNSNLPANMRGEVPAMYNWSDPLNYSKTEVWIGDAAAETKTRQLNTANTPEAVTGIDTFANVLDHEERHVYQIQVADALLPGANAAGWSWNTVPNNHATFDANNNDLPDSMEAGLVGPVSGMVEEDARSAEDVPENTYWQDDWGSPGKQHKDDKDYNN